MPRALILLPLMLVIQGAILYLLLRLVWRLFRRWDRQDREDRFRSAQGSGPHTGTVILFDF